jgi:Family of unknown function (DUF6188)
VPRDDFSVTAEAFSSLAGMTVEQIWVWGPIRLVLDVGRGPAPDTYIDFEDAVLVEPDGTETALDASEHPRDSGVVLRLLLDRLQSARHRDGVLDLAFRSGCRVRAHPDQQHEAWTVAVGPRVFQCLPGGEVDSY